MEGNNCVVVRTRISYLGNTSLSTYRTKISQAYSSNFWISQRIYNVKLTRIVHQDFRWRKARTVRIEFSHHSLAFTRVNLHGSNTSLKVLRITLMIYRDIILAASASPSA